ncbi:MAG: hypothetical protein K8963_06835, partial [Proteobacteria bacterium]|nr:hypothetical protein [Pseudomonadota bacterium]
NNSNADATLQCRIIAPAGNTVFADAGLEVAEHTDGGCQIRLAEAAVDGPLQSAATANYTVQARNGGAGFGPTAEDLAFTLTINPPVPALTGLTLRQVVGVDADVDIGLANTGGVELTACAISSNAPAGLSAAISTVDNIQSCAIVGMPTTATTADVTVTVTATNAGGMSTADVTIRVVAAPILGAPADLIELVTGQDYIDDTAITLTNTGGLIKGNTAEPPGCSISPALPRGLTLTAVADGSGCRISGNPSEASARQTYTVTARNEIDVEGTAKADIIVVSSGPSLSDRGNVTLYVGLKVGLPIVFENTGGAATSCNELTPACTARQPKNCGSAYANTAALDRLGLEVSADNSGRCVIDLQTGVEALPEMVPAQYPTERYSYTIEAVNKLSRSRAPVAILVSPMVQANAPVLSKPSNSNFVYTSGKTIEPVVFRNSGTDNDIVTCQLGTDQALPDGLRLDLDSVADACVISGRPTGQSDATNYTVSASNSAGTSAGMTISIKVELIAPDLDDIDSVLLTINSLANLPIKFTNNGGIPVGDNACVLTAPADGVDRLANLNLELAAQDDTCVIRATSSVGPPFVDLTRQTFTVIARNTIGPDMPATVTLRVAPPLDQPVVSTPQARFAGFNCVVNRSRELYCWGDDSRGQLGNGLPFINSDVPVRVGTEANWRDVDTGVNHACAINIDNELYCWGSDERGQVGNDDSTDGMVDFTEVDKDTSTTFAIAVEPVRVGEESNWQSVNLGALTSCAINTINQLWCWGDNRDWQLTNITQFGAQGISNSTFSPRPLMVGGGAARFTAIAQGERHACAIRTNGTLVCWGVPGPGAVGNGVGGDNTFGNSRFGITEVHLDNVTKAGDTNAWSAVSTGFERSCALNRSRNIYCWGQVVNIFDFIPFLPIRDTKDWSAISVGAEHFCALKIRHPEAKNELWCWGQQANGRLGNGRTGSVLIPNPVEISPG